MPINRIRENWTQGVTREFLSATTRIVQTTLCSILRLVKFVTTTIVEWQAQTDMMPDDDDFEAQNRASKTRQNTDVSIKHTQGQVPVTMTEMSSQVQTSETHRELRDPLRE